MAKISAKMKEQVYEHLRTTATPGKDRKETVKDLVATFHLPVNQAAGLVGVAQRMGWLTGNAQPKSTEDKGAPSIVPSTKVGEVPSPQSPIGTAVTAPVTVQEAPAKVEQPPIDPKGDDPTPQELVAREVDRVLHARPGAKSVPQRKELSALTLEAFQQLETGSQMVDVMADLDLTFEEAKTVLDNYNALKHAEAERTVMDERYLFGWYTLAELIGERVRDSCEHYQDEGGVCDLWDLKDVDEQFRKKYPGVFKTSGSRGTGRLRFRVLDHPEICAICHKGI